MCHENIVSTSRAEHGKLAWKDQSKVARMMAFLPEIHAVEPFGRAYDGRRASSLTHLMRSVRYPLLGALVRSDISGAPIADLVACWSATSPI